MKKNPPIIKRIVEEMGGKIVEVIPERACFYAVFGEKKILLTRKFAISRSSILPTGAASRFKDLTYRLLKDKNLPTPESFCVYKKNFDEKQALGMLEQMKYPIIIKDAGGSNSRGIFPNIGNSKDALIILKREIKNYRALLMQTMIFGKEYRLLVLDKKIIGALEMIPPYIMGNGKDKIEYLIQKKQNDTEKRTKIDKNLKLILKEQGMELDSVIPAGKKIFIRKNSSLAEGGKVKDVTENINPNIEKIVVEATKTVGRYLAGIDVICDDVSKSPQEQSFGILEINGKPDLYIHYLSQKQNNTNVIKDIIRFILDLN